MLGAFVGTLKKPFHCDKDIKVIEALSRAVDSEHVSLDYEKHITMTKKLFNSLP